MNQFQTMYADNRRAPQTASSSNGGPVKRFVQMPTGMPRGGQQQYHDDGFNDSMNWEESGGGHGHGHGGHGHGGSSQQSDKPTGLRHFSTKVCEKVKEKGLTNYNEVADELVADYFQNNLMKQIDVVKQEYDMKNIRRRVYDALNVLLAMNIITKNKKDIRWIGLPASASQEITRLEEEKARREASIKAKRETLQEMVLQIVSYKNLVETNRKTEHSNGRPDHDTLLHLPFLIINCDKETNVECSVSSDKSEFLFSFDKKFEIHDDFQVLKKLKLTCSLETGDSTEAEIKTAKSFLPRLHQDYVDQIIASHKRKQAEREEKEKQLQEQQQMQYFDQQQDQQDQLSPSAQSTIPNSGRFNRQLQEHLMNDGIEDRSAAAGIMDDESLHHQRVGPMYNNYSPIKTQHRPQQQQSSSIGAPLQTPATTRRYYVQKSAVPGQMRREMSPAVRQMGRPYNPPNRGNIGGAPIKYYVPQSQSGGGGQGPPSLLHPSAPRYRIRAPPPLQSSSSSASSSSQRVVYSSSGMPTHLGPGQRIVTQRIVTPGGPHPPGTLVRKVIRKVVTSQPIGGGVAAKPSPAQQVIQKKLMEQEMNERKPDVPMTSAQAAALIQHPPPAEYDYF